MSDILITFLRSISKSGNAIPGRFCYKNKKGNTAQ